MTQLDPITLDLGLAVAAAHGRSRLHVPGWLVLLLRNPKSLHGPGRCSRSSS